MKHVQFHWQLPAPRDAQPDKIYYAGAAGGAAQGSGAQQFKDDNVLASWNVTSINVWSGKLVNALQVVFKDDKGTEVDGPVDGGTDAALTPFVISADEGEYLQKITGNCGDALDSLVLTTNQRSSIRFGGTGGPNPYTFEAPDGYEIVGFWGTHGQYQPENKDVIGQIGIAYRVRPTPPPPPPPVKNT